MADRRAAGAPPGPVLFGELVLASLLLGGTLPLVQHALTGMGPFTFLAARFALGAVLLLARYGHRVRALGAGTLARCAIPGVLAFAAWSLQTIGLQYSTVSRVGFITALYVPFVTVFSVLLWRRRPTTAAVAGVLLSTAGLMLLSVDDGLDLRFGVGEWIVLACAAATAAHIVAIGRLARGIDTGALAAVQVTVAAVLAGGAVVVSGEPLPGAGTGGPDGGVLASTVTMGVATAVTFALMNHAQRYVGEVRATLVYALEPVWSALAGALIGERLGLVNWLGALGILCGLVLGALPATAPPRAAPPSGPADGRRDDDAVRARDP